MKRHLPFLKYVLLHALTAFGGPQAHLALLQKYFVDERHDVSLEELLEYNAICSMLPGASSTQVLTLIGYKRGGIGLGIITLIVWVFPAMCLMGLLSFLVGYIDSDVSNKLFRFITPMAIGFLLYAGMQAVSVIAKNTVVWLIIAVTSFAVFYSFKFPWIFPLLIFLSGVVTSLSTNRIPNNDFKPKKIEWKNIYLFFIVFIIVGFLSEHARKAKWSNDLRRPINLFENTYRMGSFVFGGGQVLIPMMESQFSERFNNKRLLERNPEAINLKKDEFYLGAGIVRAVPGPVFSIAAYTGGLAMNDGSMGRQIFGIVIGTIAIFLPSAFLVFFFFPLWQNLKRNVWVYRALEGINAAVVGIMLGSAFFMLKDCLFVDNQSFRYISLLVVFFTAAILRYTKIPAPFVVLLFLLMGLILN